MSQHEFPIELIVRPRPTTDVLLVLPIDVYESLLHVAASREMTMDALLKFYIGQCLRKDLALPDTNQDTATPEQSGVTQAS